jgi:hypothetical protein
MRKIEIIQTLVFIVIVTIIICVAQRNNPKTIVGIATTTEALLETINPDEITVKTVDVFGDTSLLNIPKEYFQIGKKL